jgi:hypothetical protein
MGPGLGEDVGVGGWRVFPGEGGAGSVAVTNDIVEVGWKPSRAAAQLQRIIAKRHGAMAFVGTRLL